MNAAWISNRAIRPASPGFTLVLSGDEEPGDLLDGFDALERLKRHAGLEFGVVSSAFAFHFVCVRFGLNAVPTHHNHSIATGPIFWGRLTPPDSHNPATYPSPPFPGCVEHVK